MSSPRYIAAVLLLSTAAALGCGGSKVMVPPRIDLQRHELLGIIEFSSNQEGELGPLATQRFMEEVRRDQGLVRIVELGTEEEALRDVGERRLGPSAYRELGREYEVATIFTAYLEVSDIRPAISISSDLRNLGATADVDATLTVQMIETASSVLGGSDVAFDADDPEDAYGDLVAALVQHVTTDFKVTWARR